MEQHSIGWTVEIRQLATQLRAAPDEAIPLRVDIAMRTRTPALPQHIEDCVNYQPICSWLLERLPDAAEGETELAARLRAAALRLVAYLFDFDPRIESVDVTLSAGGGSMRARASAPSCRAVAAARVAPAPSLTSVFVQSRACA